MKTIHDVKLKDTMPDSIKTDADITAMSEAIDKQLHDIAEGVDFPGIYARLDRLSSVALDHLAKQFNVSPWRDYWSRDLKSSVIKAAISTKRKRGTLSAVKKCLESMGGSAVVVPWYEQSPEGEPGTFRINIVMRDNGLTSAEAQTDVRQMIDESKPASRHYEMVIEQGLSGGINMCGIVRPAVFTKLCNF